MTWATRLRRQERRSLNRKGYWILAAVAAVNAGLAWAGNWKSLAEDGIHDPTNPALSQLQNPADALSQLPPHTAGNQVRWVDAMEQGAVTPRDNINPETKVQELNIADFLPDILMKNTTELPMVVYPHKKHAEWLDCSNCHEAIFKYKIGGTPGFSKYAILEGEFCGRCHGAVAFPMTECKLCHTQYR